MYDEVQVPPNIVVILLMKLESLFSVFIKNSFVDSADKAGVLRVLYDLKIYFSQLRERIDDNSEDDIQQNCDNKQEERKIVERPEVEALSVFRNCSLCRKELTDTTTASDSIIYCRQEAMHHGHTN